MADFTRPRAAMIGSYVPRRCGIATFTHELATAVNGATAGDDGDGPVLQVVAMNDHDKGYAYGPEVVLQIHQHRRDDYRNAADILNTGKIDIVNLQHEYGLFGGECGEYLLDLLDRLTKPVVSTLHSVLSEPSPKQKEVLQTLCKRSGAVVVMAHRARSILEKVYEVPADRIVMIAHGVPDVPFGDTEPYKGRFNLAGRPMVLTFGLLSPGKGIETMLDALAKVVPEHPNVAYVVLGVTHPGVKRESGELYRMSLERRTVELGIEQNVLFHNRYVSNDDLREYLQAADIYVTPYRAKEQITSGTLVYALACGKAIISTPYWHAQELLVNGRGRLCDFGDADGFARALREFLDDDAGRETVQRAAYEFGRNMVWPQIGRQYVKLYERVCRRHADTVPAAAPPKVLLRMSLPEVRLDHLVVMTDDTGLLQHALYAIPDRHHGYCTDDNARGLIVAAMVWNLFQDETVLPMAHTYLSFLHFAHTPDTGRFRNFMSYDRRWLEDDGSDDAQGRALWALGYLIAHAPNPSMQRLATDLFRSALRAVETLEWPRSWALSILGFHYYLRQFPDDHDARNLQGALADRINAAFEEHASDDWPWFEDVVTYDNGRIPQALIVAGLQLGRRELTERGLDALRWLLEVQTAEQGHLSVIGNKEWLRRGGERAAFDQQPLEAAALIGACKAACRASGDRKWLNEMRRCFEWFVGRNDRGLTMVDFKSRGCFDGLKPSGVNENEGAESLVSWLLSLLIMNEMQTGEPPEVA